MVPEIRCIPQHVQGFAASWDSLDFGGNSSARASPKKCRLRGNDDSNDDSNDCKSRKNDCGNRSGDKHNDDAADRDNDHDRNDDNDGNNAADNDIFPSAFVIVQLNTIFPSAVFYCTIKTIFPMYCLMYKKTIPFVLLVQ